MPNQDPLAQLRDIHLPEAVGFWPPAPGWWIMALMVIALLVAALTYAYRYYCRNRYRRLALKALADLQAYLDNNDYCGYLQQLNRLLKQTALAAGHRVDIASLSGQAWLALLDKSANTKDFSHGVGHILLDGPYAKKPENVDITELHQLSRRWIKRHRFSC